MSMTNDAMSAASLAIPNRTGTKRRGARRLALATALVGAVALMVCNSAYALYTFKPPSPPPSYPGVATNPPPPPALEPCPAVVSGRIYDPLGWTTTSYRWEYGTTTSLEYSIVNNSSVSGPVYRELVLSPPGSRWYYRLAATFSVGGLNWGPVYGNTYSFTMSHTILGPCLAWM
jgi:hypothetical protein